MSWSPWDAVTAARSCPAPATRTGRSKIPRARASTPSGASATRSDDGWSISSPTSSRLRDPKHRRGELRLRGAPHRLLDPAVDVPVGVGLHHLEHELLRVLGQPPDRDRGQLEV